MISKPKAVENPEDICFKCLGEFIEKELHKIIIPSMGWGSGFDMWSTRINLCKDCASVYTDPRWWQLEEIEGESDISGSWYKYEDEIFDFVGTLPMESQELFWNRYSTDSYTMNSQDWIDYQLDLLPHERCKEYGIYSPQERQAYQERFPICNKVKIVVYEDDSRGSRCLFRAYGYKDGTADKYNISSKCYECLVFEQREGEIEIYSKEDMEIFELEHQLTLARVMKKLREDGEIHKREE